MATFYMKRKPGFKCFNQQAYAYSKGTPEVLDSGQWALDARLWMQDAALSTLDYGHWTLHCKFLILIMRKKNLKTGKNLLVLSKKLLVTIAKT